MNVCEPTYMIYPSLSPNIFELLASSGLASVKLLYIVCGIIETSLFLFIKILMELILIWRKLVSS